MQKTNKPVRDHFDILTGYTLDGKSNYAWPGAMAYLQSQGFDRSDAAAYLQLLGEDYAKLALL